MLLELRHGQMLVHKAVTTVLMVGHNGALYQIRAATGVKC